MFDNDAIFYAQARSIEGLGVAAIGRHFKTSGKPKQRSAVFVESCSVILGEGHLRRLRREYGEYYNAERLDASMATRPQHQASNADRRRPTKFAGPASGRRNTPSVLLARSRLLGIIDARDQPSGGPGDEQREQTTG